MCIATQHKSALNLKRDFFRDNLLKLVGKTNNRPIIVTGRYRHNGYHKQYSFVDIRPFLGKGINTYRLCQHLNVKQQDTDVIFSEKDNDKLFFLIGFPSSYNYYGSKRGSLKLVCKRGLPDIFCEEELELFEGEAMKKCFLLTGYERKELDNNVENQNIEKKLN